MSEEEAQQPKKKRITVTDLKKKIEELGSYIDEEVLSWCGQLDVRLEGLEATTATHNKTLLSDVAARLEALENAPTKLQPSFVPDINARMEALENATGAVADAMRTVGVGVADWGSRMEAAEDDLNSLRSAIADLQESAEAPPLDFVIRKPEGMDKYIDSDALKAVAAVAGTMGDVLMLTRVLAAYPDFSDQERREIMSIACQAAGVPYTAGLLVRACVRYVET